MHGRKSAIAHVFSMSTDNKEVTFTDYQRAISTFPSVNGSHQFLQRSCPFLALLDYEEVRGPLEMRASRDQQGVSLERRESLVLRVLRVRGVLLVYSTKVR